MGDANAIPCSQDKIIATGGEGGTLTTNDLEHTFPQEMRRTSGSPSLAEQGETSMMFPAHPTLSESDMHDIADAVAKVLSMAGRRERQSHR